MTELTQAQQTVINQLLDHGVFTATMTPEMRLSARQARASVQTPEGRRRIDGWFQRTFGVKPITFQDNRLWLQGPGALTKEVVTILLATLKAVINTPAIQGVVTDRVIEARPVIEAVHAVVPDLSDQQVGTIIHDLFVDRFQLLIPDRPEVDVETDQNMTIDEYWDVNVDFVNIAALLVQALQRQLTPTGGTQTAIQQVNAYLIAHRYLSVTQTDLWATLTANKTTIADLWAPLQRFYLEVGDDYALLLDGQRRQITARPYFIALAVAQTLGAGVPDSEIGARIAELTAKLYPQANVTVNLVKKALAANALATLRHGFWVATPVVTRFAMTLEATPNDN